MDTFDDLEMMYDPEYHQTLFLIEEALRETGAAPQPSPSFTDIYDDKLRELIASVPLE